MRKWVLGLLALGLLLGSVPPATAQSCPIGRTCIGGEPVETGSPQNGEVPTYNSTSGEWEWGAGGSGAPTTATYITQTADGTLSAEQALSSLSTGIMRVATTTGVITSLTDSAGIAANISDESGTGALVFASGPDFLNFPTFGNGATSAGGLVIYEDTDDGTNYVQIQAQAMGANYTLTLPVDDGTASQYLQTDGSGNLSWQTVSGGASAIDDLSDASTPEAGTVVLGTGSLANYAAGQINNTVVGANSAGMSSIGYDNMVIIGNDIWPSNIATGTGAGLIAIGANIGGSTVSATLDNNVLIGYTVADQQTTTATNNVAIGAYAGRRLGSNSVEIGAYAGQNSNGSNDVLVGSLIMDGGAVAGGGSNVVVGYDAMSGGQAAVGTVAIGYGTASNVTSGSYGLYVGYNADPDNATGDYQMNIGDVFKATDRQVQTDWYQGGELRLSILDSGDVASHQTGILYGPTRATSADNDEAYISLFLDVDDGQEEMARIAWVADDVTTATADGHLELYGRVGDAAVAAGLEVGGNYIKIIAQSAAPTPAAGMLYYDTDSNELCVYNGSTWTGLIAAGACA